MMTLRSSSMSTPSRPSTPSRSGVSTGSSASLMRASPATISGTLAVGVRAEPPTPCSITSGPRSRPRRSASVVDSALRSAPVSTTKLNGPCPLMKTSTVIRSIASKAVSRKTAGGSTGAGAS
jgi:hypothetical protein